ncbi:DCL family protein [Deinococcus yunweiensis]|uniref:DCL family protein n=1 Tax=Deinococcus yunweiensis TaxID=367282 RepID=UPI00398E9F9D
MSKLSFFLGGRFFRSKTELKQYLQSLWRDSAIGDALAPEDEMIVSELLALHPRQDQKVGAGIQYIYVGLSPEGNNRCFYVRRVDGTTTDFGVDKCLKGDRKMSLFKAACRTAVTDQIEAFRKEFHSSEDGKRLIAENELIHVDHSSPTFDHIVGRFFLNKSMTLNDYSYAGLGDDNSSQIAFLDQSIADEFADFHRRHAVLEGVTKRHNLSNSKIGIRKKDITDDFFVYVKPDEWDKLTF